MSADARDRVSIVKEQIRTLYVSDEFPWIVGYSGGKDSTAVLQLVWSALRELASTNRTKPVYVISTDTMVENPIVARWVSKSLDAMTQAARAQELPITSHRLTPKLEDRFWVNLIGKGYPAPRPMFRWCTSRLKISASTDFIRQVASERGEAILCLGSRSQESAARKRVMANYQGSTRDLLHRNSDPRLDRVWVFPPISDWSNDEVWEYLIQNENPWGYSNQALFNLYRGATPDAECPLVVDTSTPSCGDSRFGCFVCTMVDKDKSMRAMIQNDADKRWMLPLAEFRDQKLRTTGDEAVRDFRRMGGGLQLFERRDGTEVLVHGPYKQHYREELLKSLLEAQRNIRDNAPDGLQDFEVIGTDELEEIRRIWVQEKHEIEDSLPRIYAEAMKEPYPFSGGDDNQLFDSDDIQLLREVAGGLTDPDGIVFQLVREMLHVEQGYRNASRRVGIYDQLERALRKHAFVDESEALEFAREKAAKLKAVGVTHEVREPAGIYETTTESPDAEGLL